jgi:hypothetical protein
MRHRSVNAQMYRVIERGGFNRARYWDRQAFFATTEEGRKRCRKMADRELDKTEEHVQRIEKVLGEPYTMCISIRGRQ